VGSGDHRQSDRTENNNLITTWSSAESSTEFPDLSASTDQTPPTVSPDQGPLPVSPHSSTPVYNGIIFGSGEDEPNRRQREDKWPELTRETYTRQRHVIPPDTRQVVKPSAEQSSFSASASRPTMPGGILPPPATKSVPQAKDQEKLTGNERSHDWASGVFPQTDPDAARRPESPLVRHKIRIAAEESAKHAAEAGARAKMRREIEGLRSRLQELRDEYIAILSHIDRTKNSFNRERDQIREEQAVLASESQLHFAAKLLGCIDTLELIAVTAEQTKNPLRSGLRAVHSQISHIVDATLPGELQTHDGETLSEDAVDFL